MSESDRLALAALASTDARERLGLLVASASIAQPPAQQAAIRTSLLEHGAVVVRNGTLIRVLTGSIEIMRTNTKVFENLETYGTCADDV